MLGHLYRYPHPYAKTLWLYVGQGLDRDKRHRAGTSSFGRRFRKTFPNTALPQPVRWITVVDTPLTLNEEETIAMFQYRTWCGYAGGMNLTFPGSANYKIIGHLGGSIGGPITGPTNGRKNVTNGHLDRIRALPQTKAAQRAIGAVRGRANVLSGHLAKIQTSENRGKGGRVSGRSTAPRTNHMRWHIRRGVVNPICKFCQEEHAL